MTASLGLTTVAYALAVGVGCIVVALAGRARPPLLSAAIAVAQVAAAAQAVADLLSVVRGRHGSELATHLGYLLTSVAILPVAAATVGVDPGRWSSAGLAVGCLLLAVVSLRLRQTLGLPVA